MVYFNAKDLTQKQNYKFLTGSVAPRPIAWIITHNTESKIVNLAPFSYFSIVASEVPLVSVSINRRSQKLKDTANNLLQNGQGVIHIVTPELVTAMNQTAATLSANQSELDMLAVKTSPSVTYSLPTIDAAPIKLEVKLSQSLPIEKDQQIISELFILEVLNYQFDDTVFDSENEYILTDNLHPISRLAGNNYAHTSNIFSLQRPK